MLKRDEVHISTVASKSVNASMAPELEHDMLVLITSAYAQTRQSLRSSHTSGMDVDLAVTCDFQQFDILTSVDLDEPLQPPFKPRNSKW